MVFCHFCRFFDVFVGFITVMSEGFLTLVLLTFVSLLVATLRTVLSCKLTVGMSICRLIVLSSVLYHASLNSRACLVCARLSR